MKPAERNGDDTVIVRLYESFGGSIATVDVRFDQPMKSCKAVDLLEEEQDASVSAVMIDQHTVRFAVRAFQIVTLRVQFLRFKMTD
jgi:alpha-mannosidase